MIIKCSMCKTEKPLSDFNKGKNKYNIHTYCRSCEKKYHKEYEKTHKEQRKIRGKIYDETHKAEKIAYRKSHTQEKIKYDLEYRKKNKDKLKEYHRIKYIGYKERCKDLHLISLYGISLETKNKMMIKQNNKCAICNTILNNECCIDHNHDTGKIRGILCHKCNLLLGHSKDNIDILQNAINYLRLSND